MFRVALWTLAQRDLYESQNKEYLKRLGGHVVLRAWSKEGALRKALREADLVWLLDERGEDWSSKQWAQALEQTQGRPIVLAIGGAEGWQGEDRERASRLIAFGRATWPHQMVKVMALEQLYRAYTILTKHPYHREG